MSTDTQIRSQLEQATSTMRIDTNRRLEEVYRTAPRRRRVRRVAALALAGVAGALSLAIAWRVLPHGGHTVPGDTEPSGRVAFIRASADSTDLFAVDVTTGELVPLERGEASPIDAEWAPDGTRLAWVAEQPDGSFALVVARSDGTDPVTIWQEEKVGDLPGPDAIDLSWSPDGSHIAFSGRVPGVGRTVMVVDAAGTGEPAVVTDGIWVGVSWSPDGELLLIRGTPTGEDPLDLFTVHPDGSGLTRLTDDVADERGATWSPDGTLIAFTRGGGADADDSAWGEDVYVMDADGSNVRRLTDWIGFDGTPVWAPDGAWIAFTSDRDATEQQQESNRSGEAVFEGLALYAMRADGSDPRSLLSDELNLFPVSWTFAAAAQPEVVAAAWLAPPLGEASAGFTEGGTPLIVVHHSDGTFTAVEAISPHQPWGIRKVLGWCASTRTFDDPFHGSRFDEYGRYVSGPAPSGLVLRTVEVVEGSQFPLRIGPAEPAIPREETGTIQEGPFCVGSDLQEAGLLVPTAAGDRTPAELTDLAPPSGSRWSVQGVLLVTEDGEVQLCDSVEGDRCIEGARVVGIDGPALVAENGPLEQEGTWLASVVPGGLDLIRT
jgi:TolB protein